MIEEDLADGHHWLRVADPSWKNALDPTFAGEAGGRWNAPRSFPVLYLNEDLVTARVNMRRFLDNKPYRPEELRDDSAPLLVEALLPKAQQVADVHSPAGVRQVGLPASYPLDEGGRPVGHEMCREVGQLVHDAGLHGVRCRSAQAPYGAGRELAWFPRSRRARARRGRTQPFSKWFWS